MLNINHLSASNCFR